MMNHEALHILSQRLDKSLDVLLKDISLASVSRLIAKRRICHLVSSFLQPYRSIVVLKSADEKYTKAMETRFHSFHVHFVGVLTFEFFNEDLLKDVLRHLKSKYSSLLVTSPRASQAIVKVLEKLEDKEEIIKSLQDFPIFSVGKASSKDLNDIGIQCLGEECGSADALVEYFTQEGTLPIESSTMPVVFLCGDKRRDVLPCFFESKGLPFEELKVYRSCQVEKFELPSSLGGSIPEWIVFFSPSGLHAVKNTSSKLPWHLIKKASIGKTTAAALQNYADSIQDASWKSDVIASKPTAEALTDSIFEYEQQYGVA
jgi:uroporphyrinogen-III synthase